MADPAVSRFMNKFSEMAASASAFAIVGLAERTGLFKALSGAGPLTVAQIADKTKLQARYLQEMLPALAASGVVLYHEQTSAYELPAAHALILADENSPLFQASMANMIQILYTVVPKVADAMKNGGGVKFSEYGPEFVEEMGRTNSPGIRLLLTRKWLPQVPGIIQRLQQGISVADIGCGTGAAVLTMAKAFPKSIFTGFDVDVESIRQATKNPATAGLQNAHFVHSHTIPTNSFDFITTFDVIHDAKDPVGLLTDIRRALKPGGAYMMIEPNTANTVAENVRAGPRAALLYSISTLHCLTQSLAHNGEGLGAAWGPKKAEEYSKKAGFQSFERLNIKNDFNAFYLITAQNSRL